MHCHRPFAVQGRTLAGSLTRVLAWFDRGSVRQFKRGHRATAFGASTLATPELFGALGASGAM
eukprot:9508902-Alexandrium_andersonii.AAC.1